MQAYSSLVRGSMLIKTVRPSALACRPLECLDPRQDEPWVSIPTDAFSARTADFVARWG